MISKYKTAKHFDLAITDTSLAVTRRKPQIDAEAADAHRADQHPARGLRSHRRPHPLTLK
ncbi:MAG: hypothetical protein WBV77_16980 [Solirubrobacteraceae bacterium]